MSVEIKKQIAILSKKENGYAKELNLVAWYGKPAKLDIREWPTDHLKAGRGITITDGEAIALRDALNTLELN